MKKICIVRLDSGNYGGIEHQVVIIATQLIARGYKVYLITSNNNSIMSQKIISLGGEVHIVDFSNLFKAGKSIAAYIKRNNIDVLQAHMYRESIACRYARIYCKNIIHIYRVHTYIDCARISNLKKIMYHILDFITQGFVDYYVSINKFNVEELINRSKIKNKKIRIINNIIVPIGVPDDLELRDWPSLSIAMVSNFVEGKGHDVLIEAIRILKERGIILKVKLIEERPIIISI